MKNILKLFRPFDYILIGLAILFSFTPMIISTYFYQQDLAKDTSRLVAIVKINGEIIDELLLDENAGSKLKTYYPNEGQYNIVETNSGWIRVKEDNSPDQIAVNTGWINKEGQILVCLPHQFVIEIHRKGEINDKDQDKEDDEDELILPI
ncbi:NusG domain II-containing protein [Streptococcus sp. 20-1249]|uniref:NusG domain II-containing protein n=1 Tax=Streptococcus hepaticus TaxID=3349163 RepID=UPI0037488536